MHGGNVMVELGSQNGRQIDKRRKHGLKGASLERICLIDYGSAGPGPWATDAVALQASIRLADAAAIAEEVAPGIDERKLSGAALCKATIKAANRLQMEGRLLERDWNAKPDGMPAVANPKSAAWARMSSLLTARMRSTFPQMEQSEYLTIGIPYVIREFDLDLGPLARVRLLAWLSALYTTLNLQLKSSQG